MPARKRAKKKSTAPEFTVKIGGDLIEFRHAKRVFEKAYVEKVLRETNGHAASGAEIAGKDRKDFYDLVKRAGVDMDDFRS